MRCDAGCSPKSTECTVTQWNVKALQHKHEIKLILTAGILIELAEIVSILRFARVCANENICTTIVTFYASVSAGVVKLVHAVMTEATRLWQIAIQQVAIGDMAPRRDPEVELLVARHRWSMAIKHRWRSGPYKAQEINFLEDISASMELEWVTKVCHPNTQVFILSYSTGTIGAFTKDRSSKPAMMTRCRSQAAQIIAEGLTAVLVMCDPHSTPADDGTRDL